jgi:uncharacterized membrane-anchored protein
VKRPWLIALLLQLAFFGAWTGLEEWRHRDAPVFLLATEGADPRDLLAGDYLALAFPDARLDPKQAPSEAEDGAAYAVRFEPVPGALIQGFSLRRAAQKVPVPDGDFSPYPAAQGWARAEARRGRLRLGIEQFYFEEDQAHVYRSLQAGHYWALVALSPDGRLRIRRLVW